MIKFRSRHGFDHGRLLKCSHPSAGDGSAARKAHYVGEPRSINALSAAIWAYPHARGGTLGPTTFRMAWKSLSPRTWGNQPDDLRIAEVAGPIPTHVGEPRSRPSSHRSAWAYPHARGGTGGVGHARDLVDGPIPTHVGEPSTRPGRLPGSRAYPHARGGTGADEPPVRRRPGLSPRTWGNLYTAKLRLKQAGPIPTHVGEPSHWRPSRSGSRAYPHARGGTSAPMRFTRSIAGLSPRTWGNPGRGSNWRPSRGPIPTHVGEPSASGVIRGRFWAYPHARGGTIHSTPRAAAGLGLSPRTWGNQEVFAGEVFPDGPIPTHVGEPSRTAGQPREPTAYPHARGGTSEH